VTQDLLTVQSLYEAWVFTESLSKRIIAGQVSKLVRVVTALLTSVSFNLFEDTLLALNFEHHLHMNVFNVVVFLGDHERALIALQIIQRVAAVRSLTWRLAIVQ
jgi:hypothetical protein